MRSRPAARASSTAYWMTGRSMSGNITLGTDLEDGEESGGEPGGGDDGGADRLHAGSLAGGGRIRRRMEDDERAAPSEPTLPVRLLSRRAHGGRLGRRRAAAHRPRHRHRARPVARAGGTAVHGDAVGRGSGLRPGGLRRRPRPAAGTAAARRVLVGGHRLPGGIVRARLLAHPRAAHACDGGRRRLAPRRHRRDGGADGRPARAGARRPRHRRHAGERARAAQRRLHADLHRVADRAPGIGAARVGDGRAAPVVVAAHPDVAGRAHRPRRPRRALALVAHRRSA